MPLQASWRGQWFGRTVEIQWALSVLRSGGLKRLAAACVRMVMENQYLVGMLAMAAGPAIAQSWWVVMTRISRVLAGMAWTRVTIGKPEAEQVARPN